MEVAALISSLGSIILSDKILTIGRASDNEFAISDITVSSHHAEIRPEQQGYSIIDLGSTNGTFVNGVRLVSGEPLHLRSGAICRLGSFEFTYYEEDLILEGISALPEDREEAESQELGEGEEEEYNKAYWGEAESGGLDEDKEKEYVFRVDDIRRLKDIRPSEEAHRKEAASESLDEDEELESGSPPSRNDSGYVRATQQGGYGWGQREVEKDQGMYTQNPINNVPSLPTIQGSSLPPQPGAAPPTKEYLQFTAFHPRIVPVETWNTLLIYAYVESALQLVRADADKFREQLGPHPSNVDVWAEQPLARGDQITIVPTFQGVTFEPERISFTWTKDWHRAFFSFNPDQRGAGSTCTGEILIFSGPLIIASLRLSLRLTQQAAQSSGGREEVSAYRYRRIFTSYSHDDTSIVLAIRKAYEVIGDDSFLDIENLRSGQRWNAELLKAIDAADLFQLFWSKRSARSRYVAQEWQYALQHYKYDGFIRPVYWEKPMTRVPKELAHLHFAYYQVSQTEKQGKNTFRSSFSNLFSRK